MGEDWKNGYSRRNLARLNRRQPSASTGTGGTATGKEMQIWLPIAQASPVTSATVIPGGAIVTRAAITYDVAYTADTTITVGQTGSASLLMGTADSQPDRAIVGTSNTDDAPQTTAWGASALPVLVTIAGGPVAGSGHVLVEYSVPGS